MSSITIGANVTIRGQGQSHQLNYNYWPDFIWFYYRNGQKAGVYTAEEMKTYEYGRTGNAVYKTVWTYSPR